jgi:hypothetical protein
MKVRLAIAATLALAAAAASSQSDSLSGRAILTVLPSHPEAQDAALNASQLEVKIDGKPATVGSLTQMTTEKSPLELILLIDGSVRTSLYGQADQIIGFTKEIPSNTQMTIGYMDNGRAALAGPLSSDPAAIDKGLHMTTGAPGSNASPYFCLADLAKHWPSQATGVRRVVVMITNGVDEYDNSTDDPYVQSAINDSLRAGITVFSMYWRDQGSHGTSSLSNGENHLLQVTEATGGNAYWQGDANPVSLQPYFEDLRRRLRNEYALDMTVTSKMKPGIHTLKVKASAPAAKVTAPQSVFLNAGAAPQ